MESTVVCPSSTRETPTILGGDQICPDKIGIQGTLITALTKGNAVLGISTRHALSKNNPVAEESALSPAY